MMRSLTPLLTNVHQYQFQQIFYILEKTWLVDKQVSENHPQLKLLANNTLSFPGSDVKSASLNQRKQIELRLNFMGLCGVDTPLPHYFIDLCLQEDENAQCLRHFLNILNQRLWCLLYRAWKKYHPYTDAAADHARYPNYLKMLSGGVLNNHDAQEYALTGLLGSKFRGACGLVSCVQYLLNHNHVTLKQFQPHWKNRTHLERLGNENLLLGDNIALGNKLLSVQQRVTLVISCVSLKFASTLWPNQLRAKRLNHLIRRYLPPHIKHDLIITVRPDVSRTLQIGTADNFLGWSTWLGQPLAQNYPLHIANHI